MKPEAALKFQPSSRTLALEPRLLYDAAAGAAVEQQHSQQLAQPDAVRTAPTDAHAPAPDGHAATQQLLVIDARINGANELAQSATPGTRVVVVAAGQDGVAAIQAALDQLGQVSSIQILGHGNPGEITLGTSQLTAASADINRAAEWASHLSTGADILLYGCRSGAGDSGEALIQRLAAVTGADVAASTNDTGSAAAGGDWTLEKSTGPIESHLDINADELAHYNGLLANASPTTTLGSSGETILLGGTATFEVTFTNPSSQPGYAPYIDVLLPATGYDGDDGATFVSATYQGIALNAQIITFGADGTAVHPIAKDASGNPLILRAADYGYRAGDQLVVLELPYASFGNGQPSATVDITVKLSELADANQPHVISVRGGFQYGNDALDNPTQDPTLIEASWDKYTLESTPLEITQTVDMVEGETVTGQNFPHSLTVTTTPAPGQTLHNVQVTQDLPDTIRVESITPGAGGLVLSITLADGTVVTGQTAIANALAGGAYLRSYTVVYPTLTQATNTVVGFYVGDTDSTGAPILDPISGASKTITVGAPHVSADWQPLDPRDVPPQPPPFLVVTDDGDPVTFTAKSITLHKSAALANDTGVAGVSPGDTLQFRYDIAVSDYFSFGQTLLHNGQLTVTDQLGDGMTFSGTPTISFRQDGVTYTVPLVYTIGAKGPGGTTITFDLATSIRNAGLPLAVLAGDISSNGTLQSGTIATVTYNAVIDEAYQTTYPQSEINEGDSLGNNALITGTVVIGPFNLGGTDTDDSQTTVTIPTSQVDVAVTQINGTAPPASYELHPGDTVTFRLSYDLVTGDYENFKLSAFLPLPLFDAAIAWSNGTGINQWSYGSGDTHPGSVLSVSGGAGNSVVFNFGNFILSGSAAGQNRIELVFTMRVSDQPFADQRSISVVGQSSQTTTINQQVLVSTDVEEVHSVAEPVLSIKHGVVSSTHGTVTGTTGTWAAAGSAGAAFTQPVTDIDAVEGTVTGIDAGDVVRLATAIENTGGGGAYDVVTTLTLPPNLTFLNGSLAAANLRISRGDGALLQAGVDYSVSGNTITFLDAGNQATFLAGRPGSANDVAGTNMVIITYDTVVAQSVLAGQNLQTVAALTNYASINGGTDFTPTDLTDTADELAALPVVTKVFAGGGSTPAESDSSASHTTGANLVIGESMLYDIVVTLPEGSTQNLRLTDIVPDGLTLDTSFGNGGYQLIVTRAGSGALAADFAGSVNVASISPAGGAAGADGTDMQLTFSASSADGDNNTANNSFVIRVRLVASNVISNQAGRQLANNAAITFTDPDGDVPNGTTGVDRGIALTGTQPTVTIVEPTLTVRQDVTSTGTIAGVDRGDQMTYTITLRNGTSSSDVNAYDVWFVDNLPEELINVQITGVTLSGGATISGPGDFVIVNGVLQSAPGTKLDIPRGGAVAIQFTGTLSILTGLSGTVDNQVNVTWTSLDGANTGERTGTDGVLNSGVLNDYQINNVNATRVAAGSSISHVGGDPDTPLGPTVVDQEDVAVGEIIHYRVAFVVPEGVVLDGSVQIYLPEGLTFLNDGSAAISFISDPNSSGTPGLTTTLGNLAVGGTLYLNGGVTSSGQTLLQADLGGQLRAQGIVNTSLIDTSNGRVIVLPVGSLVNLNQDPDFEGFYFEFNVRVDNTANVTAGALLPVHADFLSEGQLRTSTAQVVERVVEPRIVDLDKSVVAFDPGVGSAFGQATYSVSFSNSGTTAAHDVVLTDSLPPGGQALTVQSVVVNGVTYSPGGLPPGFTLTNTGTQVTLNIDYMPQGGKVSLIYSASLPNNTLLADTAATVTYTSLSNAFTTFGGSNVGPAGSATGERTGSLVGPNNYQDSDAAGVSYVSGTLWNDTDSATGSSVPDGPSIAGQTVTLTWGGADNNLDTTADNQTWTTTTDANGFYSFGVLGRGVFRIDAPPTIVLATPTGTVNARIDSDPSSPLARVQFSGGDSGAAVAGNVGYVERNDPPVNILPTSPSTLEDNALPIVGLAVSDPDAGNGIIRVTLSVLHGTLTLTPGATTVVAGALGTATFTLEGSQTDISAALATLLYTPSLNYNGNETLTIRTDDLGQRGDANGDGIPFDPVLDNLTAINTLTITVIPVNDPPEAKPDVAFATEAGGTANGTPGVNPSGNVLTNDIDVDIATNGDVLKVERIAFGANSSAVTSTASTVIAGLFGTLRIGANGAFQYVVDNNNATVQALRLPTDTLTEVFTYTISDLAGVQSSTTLTVTIRGANDAPVAGDDTGDATEAGGAANGTPGSDATGNVLINDGDIDTGDSLTVTRVRTGTEAAGGPASVVPPGTTSANGGLPIAGLYGTLVIGADGSYVYRIDNNNAAVQALNVGDTLQEVFTYAVTDAGGLNDTAALTITIHGANDNPVAVDNEAQGYTARQPTASNPAGGTPINPAGNVITDEHDPASIGQVDSDVDDPVSSLVVSQIRPAGGSDTPVSAGGITLLATYGTLVIHADGSYTYLIDNTNPALIALGPNDTVTDSFVYTLLDPHGGTSTANLNITIHGVNDAPVAQDVTATAKEAGGVNNTTPGTKATGDATLNDIDPDGDAISVIKIAFGSTTLDIPVGGSIDIAGAYGTLNINDHGVFTYTVNDSLTAVQALRRSTDVLIDTFTYTDSDGTLTAQAQIRIRITGQNDNPIGVDDTAVAREAGGIDNNTPGVNPSDNVLTNDTDVDQYGETKTVAGARAGDKSAGAVADSGTNFMLVTGQYGTLLIRADGTYVYLVDNSNPTVDALNAGQSIQDVFTYKVRDAAGATDLAQLTITINGANDAPVAASQRADAIEAGGTLNGTPGVDPGGNLLLGLYDPDTGDTAAVTAFRTGAVNDNGGTVGTLGTYLQGRYGVLLVNADGTYQYVVDNNNPVVERLRTNFDTLTDVFTFTVTDAGGLSNAAELHVTIHGRDDAPVAKPDTGEAIEAGGTFNGTPGKPATGNVLINDTDVDAGDTKAVSAFQTAAGAGGTVGASLTGLYGSLTLSANGDYVYNINDALTAVQALKPGDTLTETFTYTVRDTAGLTSTATLTITILGRYDAPVAVDDAADATPATSDTPPVDATGNVVTNDKDVDANDTRTVTGIRSGAESTGATLQDMSGKVRINGLYGWLDIDPTGQFQYHADETNTIVAALAPGQTLVERFTYRLADGGGLTDTAELAITIHGINDRPVASDVITLAREAGGVANGTVGRDPSGVATFNDVDPEGGPLTIVALRTGAENGTGTSGIVGVPLRGQYGTLVMGADGRFTYTVDNNLPEVQALRMLLDGLVDTFTYTVSDDHGATDQATLRVLILGQNDNPVAHDDAGNAIEAGGRHNATPGTDATGNVLDNDTDVDQYGETKAVTAINGPLGAGAVAGTTAGRYGTLTVQADGSYRYVIDNDNAAVQALRTSDETLTETFVYVVADRAGATATATLTITIHGQNDAPVARDDSNNVDNIHGQPITSGNVLPNDSDVDAGDQLTVVGIRPGAKDAGGASTSPGTRIAGSYGYLQLNADGSYTYEIDLTNPAVQAAAGRGSILKDIFTYTIADRAGAIDSAQLVISLNIDAPYVPPPGPGDHEYFLHDEWHRDRFGTTLGVDPVVYVTPEVQSIFPVHQRNDSLLRGENLDMVTPPHIQSPSLAAGLGMTSGEFLRPALLQLEAIVQFEAERTAGRHGIVSLSADGLLRDPSVFALKGIEARPEKAAPSDGKHDKRGKSAKPHPGRHASPHTEPARPAASFTDQIRQLASRPSTVAALSHANNSTNEDAKK
ncbi:hypothetical protein Cmtc_35830 [Cupriavidus sp. TKC]|uniref:VCBS domain-containing protein n=1 Tax=unclassified Cupriavidus TaxID=2640874 RepID=UPI00257AA427|nr:MULTISPECIES: VCBS domain-containing protein [unclassified Cupriavidus]GMG92363.1 hypothetical protein Cmtc_35830 [Cupriavidus sp. TKC]